MYPVPHDFQMAIKKAKKDQSTHLSLRGDKGDLYSRNILFAIPEAVFELSELKSLDLSNNLLRALPLELKRLKKLKQINIALNPLDEIPDRPGLILDSDQVFQFVEVEKTVTPQNVIGIRFRRSGLKRLEHWFSPSQGAFQHIEWLDLSNNLLQTLPESITKLTNLSSLYLYSNQLSTLPESITKLTNLTSLNLSSNQLSTLPESITKLTNLTALDLSNIPFTSPPQEVIEKGILAIEDYFRQASLQGTIPLYEARILIVGEAGAGKTTLKKKLINPDYQLPEKGEDSTLGIEVENNWSFPFTEDIEITFTAHLWDFGGQEIQYMTHQFFLRDRSLYILVADDRRQDADFDYWFKAIHLFGKGSPVLVVLNERNYKSVTNFDLNYYKKLYPELEIHQFSVDLGEDKERILKLTKQVQTFSSKLKHVGDEIPKQWVPIREALAAREAEHHICYKDFVAICNENKVADEQSALFISGYLDALGLIVHFKDDPNLHDFVIVDPKWLVKAVYAVLEDKTLEENKGRFTQDWIFDLWKQKGYKHDECCKLISLIKKDSFEICYELKNHEVSTYIAPQLLPSKEPAYEWEDSHNLHFRFAYPFMPKGIIARLIVRMSEQVAQNADEPLIWKRGAVFEEGKTRAEVTVLDDPETGVESINIRVRGEARAKRDLLTVVRSELRHMHQRSFQNIGSAN